MSVNFKKLSDDDCYKRWQDFVERIKTETVYLFGTRAHYQEVVEMFRKNEALGKDGGDVYGWLTGMWGRDALIALRRELDGQSNTINLVHLFEEMEGRPTVMTRRRYLAFIESNDHVYMKQMMNNDFDKWGAVADGSGDPLNDYIPASATAADRVALEKATNTAFDYAQRMVAHRTPVDSLEIKVKDINEAIDAIEPVVKKYYCMFTARGLTSVVPAVQFDWGKPFDIAWRLP